MCKFAVKWIPFFELHTRHLGNDHPLRRMLQRLCVPAMHVQGHCATCQWLNGQFRRAGTGMFFGEVNEVWNRTIRMYHTNFRNQKRGTFRSNAEALIHAINIKQVRKSCEIMDSKAAHAMAMIAKYSAKLDIFSTLYPQCIDKVVEWSSQLRDAAKAALAEERAGRAGFLAISLMLNEMNDYLGGLDHFCFGPSGSRTLFLGTPAFFPRLNSAQQSSKFLSTPSATMSRVSTNRIRAV